MKYRLAILDSHPIQYRAPLFKRIAQDSDIDLVVYYCSRRGVVKRNDPGFNVSFKWDTPLLDGYKYKFLNNLIPFAAPQLLFNPGLILELKKEKFDAVIIFGYAVLNNWILVLLAPMLKTRLIFTGETIIRAQRTRNIFFVIKRLLLKLFFFRNISSFLYIGSKSREFYRYFRISDDRLFFSPYCLDNDFFIPRAEQHRPFKEEIKKEIGIPGGLPVILYAGKIISRKRPQDLLRAFERMQAPAALVFVGDGKLRPFLEDYVFKNRIKNVFFLRFKNQTELPRYYAMADLFVLPSEYEPWGLAINEAMCAGLPIITTDRVACAYDLVKTGENGYVLSVADIDRTSRILDELAADPQKRKRMGGRSLEVISNWNYDICIQGIIKALDFLDN